MAYFLLEIFRWPSKTNNIHNHPISKLPVVIAVMWCTGTNNWNTISRVIITLHWTIRMVFLSVQVVALLTIDCWAELQVQRNHYYQEIICLTAWVQRSDLSQKCFSSKWILWSYNQCRLIGEIRNGLIFWTFSDDFLIILKNEKALACIQ